MEKSTPKLNQPVRAMDPSTNYYGDKVKMRNPELQKSVDKGYGNMHGNLANEGDDHKDTQGDSNKVDRMKAMARRMGKAY